MPRRRSSPIRPAFAIALSIVGAVTLATFPATCSAASGPVHSPKDAGQSRVARAVPLGIPFQGFLADGGGDPVQDAVNLEFALYDASAAGTTLWSESQLAVTVTDGVFQVELGEATALTLSLFDGAPLWLGVRVNGEAEMPRTQLLAVPFAMRAAVADSAVAVGAADDGDWTISGGNVIRETGKVGIGVSSPEKDLHTRSAKLGTNDGSAYGTLSMTDDTWTTVLLEGDSFGMGGGGGLELFGPGGVMQTRLQPDANGSGAYLQLRRSSTSAGP